VLFLVLDSRSFRGHAILLAVDEGPASTAAGPGISIRRLAPGDEEIVRELANYDRPGVQWDFTYTDD
jgi:hypothetical protein